LALGFLATKARSDVLTLDLPAGLVAALVDAVDHLGGTADEERRLALDKLTGDLAGAPPRVTARGDLLRELVAVAVEETAERLGVASNRLLRGEASAPAVRGLVAQLTGLLDLLEAVDDS
jgi:hypothetical protein